MLEFLPQDVKDGLDAARRDARRPSTRMRIKVGGHSFTLLRSWEKGFSIKASEAPPLRGHVDLYDGARHVGCCLIVACGQDGDEMIYEFKRNTPVSDRAPLDFAPDDLSSLALIGRQS